MLLPPYNSFPNIEDEKVSLRQIVSADINDLIEISFYDAIQATSVQEAAEIQARIDRDYENGNSIHWGIADTSTNAIVGTCGYYRGLDNGSGELGCILLPRYRGKGFMKAALQLAIDFGVNKIGLTRIHAITSGQNDKAIQLLYRLNFVKMVELSNDEIDFEYHSDTKCK